MQGLSDEAPTCEKRGRQPEEQRDSLNLFFFAPLPSYAFSHARDHLRVSRASPKGLRKKRDC